MIDQPLRILVIDDDPELLDVLRCGLSQEPEYQVTAVSDAEKAVEFIQRAEHDLVVTDYSLGHAELDGITMLQRANKLAHPPLVIIITAFASIQITLDSIKLGAHNFLTKPFQLDELYLVVRNAANLVRLERDNRELRLQLNELKGEFEQLRVDQQDLVARMHQMGYEGAGIRRVAGDEPATDAVDAGAVLEQPQVLELRRRRLRDQMSAYTRAGELLSQRMDAQAARLAQLDAPPRASDSSGLLDES